MPLPRKTPTKPSNQKSPYLTDDTCLQCRKANDEGDGYVGCWCVGQRGAYYTKHLPHHACGQFVPHDVWGFKHKKENSK